MNLFPSCPFCRQPVPNTEREMNERREIRSKANDPAAICFAGLEHLEKGNKHRAFAYFTKAAELGDVEAHYQLSNMYQLGLSVRKDGRKVYYLGEGVEKNVGKEIYHLEEAAIGGHPEARHRLGVHEWSNGNFERAVKHWIIAARHGYNESIKQLMKIFKLSSSGNEGAIERDERDEREVGHKPTYVSKEVLDATLRAHKAAVDATKSPQREAAERRVKNQGNAKCWI